MFKTPRVAEAYQELMSKTRLHSYGGDCYAYGLVALGTHDLVVENSLHVYDIQAHIPIIEAAGGIITSWEGGPADLGGTALVASSRQVHEQALEILRPAISDGP